MPASGGQITYGSDVYQRAAEYVNGGHVAAGDTLPSVAGLACHLDYSRDCMYKWARKYPEFAQLMDKLKSRQEKIALEGGLTNELNATIVKLMLVSNHGYTDRKALDHQSSDGSMTPKLQIEFIGEDTTA